ncbi:MAG: DUF5011 domain-containing protein [Lachnospiraceae bacterium]|nr:DUF5011 domain-containing protein [Lachnospiraceae bacterium]
MKKKILSFLIILIVLGAAGGYLYYDHSSRVYTRAVVEAGNQVTAADFAKDAAKPVEILSFDDQEGATVTTDVPGDHYLTLRSGFYQYKAVLTIQDTVAPVAEVQDVSLQAQEEILAKDFIMSVQDATATTVSFTTEPDPAYYGNQTVHLAIEDLGGNVSEYEATLTINPIITCLTLEAGSEIPEATDFMLAGLTSPNLRYQSGANQIDPAHVGEYPVSLRVDSGVYESVVQVVDTVAPKLQVQDLTGYTTSDYTVESFVVSAEDATDITFRFQEDIDLTKEGTQNATVIATDEGGNETTGEVSVTLVPDKEAPVITGVKDRTIYTGEGIAYRSGVTVTDNCDGDIALSIDTSGVSLNDPGTYTVTYSATDRAGNTTSQTANITVKGRNYDIATIDALAYGVLSGIINDSMTPMDKLNAIYNWVRRNVRYVNHSDKSDFNRGAFEGLYDRKGDCFVYAATSHALLSRAGITTRIIAKIPARTSHYWNLVDIGEGWHHFDTTPRVGGFTCVYMTDTELMNYSNAHHGSHNYDPTVYTDIVQ